METHDESCAICRKRPVQAVWEADDAYGGDAHLLCLPCFRNLTDTIANFNASR